MPNRPAPDEVAQLPEWAGVYTASDIESLLRDTERVLKYLRWDGKMAEKHEIRMIGKAVEEGEFTVARKLVREMIEDRKRLTARVAELEAELETVKADKISVWAALLATGKVIEEELMRLAGPEPGVEMVGGPTHTAPGKEPTSE